MKEEEEIKQGFIVKDRRRFDDDGKERVDVSAETSEKEAVIVESNKDSPEESVLQEVTFNSFVVSLATQALAQLGEMKPPEGLSIPVDVDAAKRTIDLLAMLKEKTKGNLNEDEEQLLDEVLHTLRLGFVRAK